MKPEIILKEALDIIKSVFKRDSEIDKEVKFPVGFTSLLVLERVRFSFESILVLVKDGIIKNDHAIGLLSRNLLTDFITTGYILKLSKSEDELHEKLYHLYSSDLARIDSFLKMYNRIKENLNEVHRKMIEEAIKKQNEKYENENDIYKFIRNYSKDFELKDPFPGTKKIIEEFFESKMNDVWAERIRTSYDMWIFYSKYEHLGWYSYAITRDPDEEKSIIRLRSTLFNSLIMISSSFEILGEKKALDDSVALIKKIANN